MRKILSAFFLAIALVFGTIAAAPVSPASADSDCSQSAALGDRICFDKTTGYGPVILIYTGANTLYASFGVTAFGMVDISAQFVFGSAWYTVNDGVAIPVYTVGGTYTTAYAGPYIGTPVMKTNVAANINLLRWFGSGCCETMEWVIAN